MSLRPTCRGRSVRVFLDENVPRQIRLVLSGHDVSYVEMEGWKGVDNGALLNLVAARFDALISSDGSIFHQQDLRRRALCRRGADQQSHAPPRERHRPPGHAGGHRRARSPRPCRDRLAGPQDDAASGWRIGRRAGTPPSSSFRGRLRACPCRCRSSLPAFRPAQGALVDQIRRLACMACSQPTGRTRTYIIESREASASSAMRLSARRSRRQSSRLIFCKTITYA